MMRSVFRHLQEQWDNEKMGVEMSTNGGQDSECRVSHMIFADNCYVFAASKEEIEKMMEDTTEELRRRGIDWTEDQMEMMARGEKEAMQDVLFDHGRCAVQS